MSKPIIMRGIAPFITNGYPDGWASNGDGGSSGGAQFGDAGFVSGGSDQIAGGWPKPRYISYI